MKEIKLARRLNGEVVGWIAKINGRGRYFKHRRAAEWYVQTVKARRSGGEGK